MPQTVKNIGKTHTQRGVISLETRNSINVESNPNQSSVNLSTVDQTKPNGPSISIRVIEDWLEETLENVQELQLVNKLLKDDKKSMVSQYGIDR